jgi:hypothetical protein
MVAPLVRDDKENQKVPKIHIPETASTLTAH